jgi:hypothetical protein
MLLLMTVSVLFLMRRGAVDELLASNVRQVTTLDTAAQYALRTCERLLWRSPPGVAPAAGDPNPPPTVMAPAANATAAWRNPANWANSALTLPPTDFGPGVLTARCLIEDAGNELEIILDNARGQENQLKLDGTWRKYRITAEVTGSDNTFGRAQAEVRMNVVGT